MLEFADYTKKCKITKGSIKRVYIMPWVKYTRSQIKSDGMKLTKFPASTFYLFDCLGNYSQQSSVEGGATFFDQTINIQLSEVYNILDIHKFLKIDFRVIVETNNDDLIMFGVHNGLECKTSNTTGTSKADFNGFSLDFTGKEEKTGLLIKSLEELENGIEITYNYIFEDGENFIFQDDINYIFNDLI